jgi:hypothetical protein
MHLDIYQGKGQSQETEGRELNEHQPVVGPLSRLPVGRVRRTSRAVPPGGWPLKATALTRHACDNPPLLQSLSMQYVTAVVPLGL